MSTLEIRDLHVEVETEAVPKEILRGVDLTVNSNETHAIMGPNGSGKSTLAYSIAGPPEVHRDQGPGPPRRRGRAGDGRRRARPRRPVPRHAVPGRGPRRLDVELPALRRHRLARRGAEGAALGQGGQGRDDRPRDRPGVRRAQRQRGLLRWREEAPRDAADVAAEAEDRGARRDRLGPRRRRPARRVEGVNRYKARSRATGRRPADHPLHPHPAVHPPGPRPRVRRRPGRRVRGPRARRRARDQRLRAVPGSGGGRRPDRRRQGGRRPA